MSYVYGLTGLPDSTGQKTIDKQVLLIEPLEYKEDKLLKTLSSPLIHQVHFLFGELVKVPE